MLILASQSSARKALLSGAGLRFEARPAKIDERALELESLGNAPPGAATARFLALAKAKALSAADSADVVMGADQTLELEGALLHKPGSLAEAREQLLSLRGRTHHLHSGVALVKGGIELWSAVETASLTFRAFSPAELDTVLALEGEAVLHSVGGYRLEGPAIRFFERIDGDYFTILGLPLLPLLAALRQHAPETLESPGP